MTKSALSRVMTRSMALVASGTDCSSLVSPRISSTCMRLPPTLMPPALLISSRAISAPAQWFSPCTNDIGPRIAILIVFCAEASDEKARADARTAAGNTVRNIKAPPLVYTGTAAVTIDVASKSRERLGMPKADFACLSRLRVRWAEVDMQKIVFNGHYLTYIDTAIAQYWREIGLPYPHGYVERYANDIFLRKATLEYLGSARYDDELTVYCRVAKLGRSSMTFSFEICRGAEAPLATAELVYVNADLQMRPAPLPDEVREKVRRYERVAPQS